MPGQNALNPAAAANPVIGFKAEIPRSEAPIWPNALRPIRRRQAKAENCQKPAAAEDSSRPSSRWAGTNGQVLPLFQANPSDQPTPEPQRPPQQSFRAQLCCTAHS